MATSTSRVARDRRIKNMVIVDTTVWIDYLETPAPCVENARPRSRGRIRLPREASGPDECVRGYVIA
jgi:hypothetical protein